MPPCLRCRTSPAGLPQRKARAARGKARTPNPCTCSLSLPPCIGSYQRLGFAFVPPPAPACLSIAIQLMLQGHPETTRAPLLYLLCFPAGLVLYRMGSALQCSSHFSACARHRGLTLKMVWCSAVASSSFFSQMQLPTASLVHNST